MKKDDTCPICEDKTNTCKHMCYGCDKICPEGTCADGYCESCCGERCES